MPVVSATELIAVAREDWYVVAVQSFREDKDEDPVKELEATQPMSGAACCCVTMKQEGKPSADRDQAGDAKYSRIRLVRAKFQGESREEATGAKGMQSS